MLQVLPLVRLSVTAIVLFVICQWLLKSLHRAYRSPLAQIPGPWYASLTHLWLKYHVVIGRRLHYIHAMHHRYGDVVRIAPNEVAIADIAGFKQIHAIGGGFLKSDWYEKLIDSPILGIFSMTDPKAHAARRRLLARPFSKSALREAWEPQVRRKAELAVGKIFEEAAAAASSDVLKWWTLMATDVATMLMFGEDFGMLEIGKVSRSRCQDLVAAGTTNSCRLPENRVH